jgi:hypothetical protein
MARRIAGPGNPPGGGLRDGLAADPQAGSKVDSKIGSQADLTPGATSPGASLIAAENALLAALESLLRRNAYSPRTPALPPPEPYTGPDADLLRLQQEVIGLAIEALRTKPGVSPGKKP